MKDFAISALILIYAAFLVGGTAYLVGWQGWSAWWFLMTLCLMPRAKWGSDE